MYVQLYTTYVEPSSRTKLLYPLITPLSEKSNRVYFEANEDCVVGVSPRLNVTHYKRKDKPMGDLGFLLLTGYTETVQVANLYPIDTLFKEIGAVYIFTRAWLNEGKIVHSVLYIGQTSQLGTRIASHNQWDCLRRNGANRIGIIQESSEVSRRSIEEDLVKSYQPCCNDQLKSLLQSFR